MSFLTPADKNNDKEKVERRKESKYSTEFPEKLDKNGLTNKGVTKKNYHIRSHAKKILDKLKAATRGVL